MAIELICRSCGETYTVTRKELLQPPAIYRLCGSCQRKVQTPPEKRVQVR